MNINQESCRLCQGNQLQCVYTHATGLPLVRCAHCGLIFFLFREEDRGQIPDYWTTGGSRHNLEVYSDPKVIKEATRTYSRHLSWLETEIGIGKLIDYGCGIGAFIDLAQARGWKVYGLDGSEMAVEYARARGLPAWTVDEWTAAEPVRAGKGMVDVVTMWDVIEHVEDPPKVLQSISFLLRDEGILLLETPSANYLPKRLSLWLTRLSRDKIDLGRFFFYPDHRFYFTPKTLRQLLKDCGFHVIWNKRVTSPRTKIMRKLRKVHRAGRLTQALVWLTLQITKLLGGNKIIICARKQST